LTTKIKIAIQRHQSTTRGLIMDDANQRCSRPLCSSQHTIGTSTPPPTGRFTLAQRRTRRPNPHQHSRVNRKPGPSGPNNVHQPTRSHPTRSNPASRAY